MEVIKSSDVEIQIPNDVQILYTDGTYVQTGKYGMVINFAQGLGGDSKKYKVISRLGLSRRHAEDFLNAIQDNIVKLQAFEEKKEI